jgi:lysophospholipase L1-like esterase
MKPIYEVGDGIHLSEAGYKIWADALAHRMPNEN